MNDDVQLFVAWRDGESAAGEKLVERYYPSVVRFFANKVTVDPLDLVHETFEACLHSVEEVREPSKFRSFLFGVAYNRLRLFYEASRKSSERLEPHLTASADLAPGASTLMARAGERRILLEALRTIPVELQVILELFYWEGMTSADIADMLAIPHGTARSRIRRARERLRDRLRTIGGDTISLSPTETDVEDWALRMAADLAAEASDDLTAG